MNKWVEILFGLILLNGIIFLAWYSPAWGSFWNFRHATWEFVKGGAVCFFLLIGLVLIMLGISDLKD